MRSGSRSIPVLISSLAIVAASLAVFLTYLVPQWLAFFRSDVFVFTNGWDEETYMSWQGAEGFKTSPGYFPLYLNSLLQTIGLSGAHQNLLFDTVLPPATALLVFLTLRIRDVEPFRAVGYATLICFGSVLFNANNPLILRLLGPTRDNTIFFMSGWEVYASILRTPNPEIPFFLIACAVYGSVRLQKWWILLLPLPLLYYPTAVPYAFLLLLMFTYRQIRSRYQTSPARALLAGSAITFVVAGIGLVGLSYLMGLYQPDNYFRAIAYLFSETRRPQVPVALIALAVLLALGLLCRIGRLEPPMIIAIAILAIAAVGSVNLHLVTGFMLSQKNYYDYGLSVLLAVIAVVQIDSLRHPLLKNATLLAVLAAITLYSSRSQAIWYDRAIELSQELSPDIEKVRRDPLRAVFFKTEDAANVAYSTARLLGPISNLYSTREYATQCGGYVRLAKDAITLVKQRFPEKEKQLVRFFNSAAVMEWSGRTNKKSIPDYSYCRNVDLENRDFYLVGPEPP